MTGSDDDDDDDVCFTVKAKVSSRDNFDKQSGTVTLRIRLKDEQYASITITKGDDLLDSCSKFGAEHGLDYSSVNHLFEQLKERYRLISQFRDVKYTTDQLIHRADADVGADGDGDGDFGDEKRSNQDKNKERFNSMRSETMKSVSSKNNVAGITLIAAASQPTKSNSFSSTSASTSAPTSSSSSPLKNIPSASSMNVSSSPAKRFESAFIQHSDRNILLQDDRGTLQNNSNREVSPEESSKDILQKIPKIVLNEIEDSDEKQQENAYNIAKKNLEEWNTMERSPSPSSTKVLSHFRTTNKDKEREKEKEKEREIRFDKLERKLQLDIPSEISSPSKKNILLSNKLNLASNIFTKEEQGEINEFSSAQNSINKNQKSSTLRSSSPSLIQQKKSSERMHGHGQKFENKKAYLRIQFEKDRIETIQSTTFR
jgi:hypothetical protein